MHQLSKTFQILVKIFLLGLLLQFILHTFVTYKLGYAGWIREIIWLRKEVVLGVWCLALLLLLVQKVQKIWWLSLRNQIRQRSLFRFFCVFVVLIVVSLILAMLVQKVGLGAYILSVKYNLFGFLIFLLGALLIYVLPISYPFHTRYQKLLKRIVFGAFFWRVIIVLAPSFLKLFGYSRSSYEGTLSTNPPAVYYTQINHGHARNQFLFERPISFGFFLVAFWPLFALTYLRKQSRRNQLLRTCAFWLIVLSTYSRAAIGAWILQTAILILLLYPKKAKKLILWWGVPTIIILIFAFFYFKSVFVREHSTTWHLKLLLAGIEIGLKNPITGRGIGYSGPASHQLCLNAPQTPRCQIIAETNQKYSMTTPGYNPENQYVQIFMEYGLLGLIPWLLCFGWLLWESLRLIFPYLKELKKGKKADRKQLTQLLIGIAFGLGLRGLALEGLMLHSFVDRMIVYPFMLLWGLRYGQNVLVQSEQKPN